MTENRAFTPTDLADRWRRFCEAMLGELRPETGRWWRSGAFWLLSWVMRRRMRREAAAAAAMIQAMMQEVLAALEAVGKGKVVAVAEPEVGPDGGSAAERVREVGIPAGGTLDSGIRRNDGFGKDGNDGCSYGGRADPACAGGGPSCGTLGSGFRRNGYSEDGNDGCLDGGRADSAITGADAGCGALDSGLRRNDEYSEDGSDGFGADGEGVARPLTAPRARTQRPVAPLRFSASSAVRNLNRCRALTPRARSPPVAAGC